MKNIKKIFAILMGVIIAVGIFFAFTKGFKYGIEYTKATEFKFVLGQVLDMNEVNTMVNEAFINKETKVQKIDYFNDSINLTVVDPTDEELQSLIDKFNNRYNQNNTIESIIKVNTNNISFNDIVWPYILPVLIIILVTILYMVVRYKKVSILKTVFMPILATAFVEALIFSIYAIVRLPINLYTMPIALFALLATLTIVAAKFEKV